MMFEGTPAVIECGVDPHEDLIQMPGIAGVVTRGGAIACGCGTELATPMAEILAGDRDAARDHDERNVAHAQAEQVDPATQRC
jgi:hypothetical protein